MKNLNIKYFVYIFLGLIGIIWFLLGRFYNVDFTSFKDFYKLLPKVAIIVIIMVSLFIKWMWKWKIFHDWLVPFPNLEGTWEGYILSSWINPKNNERINRIPCILSIKQSFTKISCVLRTAEMTSYSIGEEFRIEDEKQIKQIGYQYTSKPLPLINKRSPTHDGSALFSIVGNPVNKLNGQYWTARDTKGEIELTYRCKEILDEIPDDIKTHPMSDSL